MRTLITVVVIVFFFVANPFGFKTATEEGSVIIFNKLFASFYPGANSAAPQATIGQDRIAVALMTDRAAEALAGGYPVPLAQHGRVIADILCAGAKAVFVDLNFRWERIEGDAAEFYDLLRYRRTDDGCKQLEPQALKSGAFAPVIIGHVRSHSSLCDPFEPSPESCKSQRGFAGLARLRDVAHIIDLPEPLSDLRYDLGIAAGHKPARPAENAASMTEIVSPAWAMLRALCAGDKKAKSCVTLSAPTPPNESILTLRWGFDVSPRDRGIKDSLGGRCPGQRAAETESGKVWNMRRPFGFGESPPEGEGYCPYHDTMVASDIREAARIGNKIALKDLTGNQVLRIYFNDRAVFYGIQIAGIGDEARSPTIGRLPGVYAHAMALDNLITQGRRYWHDPPQFGWWNAAEWIDFLLSLLFIGIAWIVEEKNDEEFQEVALAKSDIEPFAILKWFWDFPHRCGNALRCLARRQPVRRAQRVSTNPAIPAERERAYRNHNRRNWIVLGFGFLVVISVTIVEMYWLSWPPNDWLVLAGVIVYAMPSHRKYDEWTGSKHPYYRRVVGFFGGQMKRKNSH